MTPQLQLVPKIGTKGSRFLIPPCSWVVFFLEITLPRQKQKRNRQARTRERMKPRSLAAAFGSLAAAFYCGLTANKGSNWLANRAIQEMQGPIYAPQRCAMRCGRSCSTRARAARAISVAGALAKPADSSLWCPSYDQPGHMWCSRAIHPSSAASSWAAAASTSGWPLCRGSCVRRIPGWPLSAPRRLHSRPRVCRALMLQRRKPRHDRVGDARIANSRMPKNRRGVIGILP